MSLHWSPLPHLGLADGERATEIVLNITVYAFTVGIAGSLVWLAALAWTDRAR